MNFYELSALVEENQQEGVLGDMWQGAKTMTKDAAGSLKRSYQHGTNQVNRMQNRLYGQERADPYPEPEGQQAAPAQNGDPAQQVADLQKQVTALTQQVQQLMAAQQPAQAGTGQWTT